MSHYTHHSLALTDEEQNKLNEVKKSTGYGVKKIFMAMIEALLPKVVDETKGDGVNKSAITLNLEED